MKVFSFVGPSGTGKSHRAQWVAKEHNIECIIDDGLLIRGNRVISGHSAKKEGTKIASVKRALFNDRIHAEEVRDVLRVYDPESILILGTSEEMAEKIAFALDLPEISEVIRIEDVATQEEMNKAQSIRRDEGKHVIPVPTFEIKKDFSGYFLDPLRVFKQKSNSTLPFYAEKSVVRPTFSYLGKYVISDSVINNMVDFLAMNTKGIHKTVKSRVKNMPEGAIIDVEVAIDFGTFLPEVLKKLQSKIQFEIEKLTGLNILAVNVIAKTIYVEK